MMSFSFPEAEPGSAAIIDFVAHRRRREEIQECGNLEASSGKGAAQTAVTTVATTAQVVVAGAMGRRLQALDRVRAICHDASRRNQEHSQAMRAVVKRMDEAVVLLEHAVAMGQHLVESLDQVLAYASRTSDFNRQCQDAITLAEAIDSPESLARLEAMRDALARQLADLAHNQGHV